MADKKISALTGASTPLVGTEVLPIVQGSATVKVAVSDLTAGRAVATGALTTTGAISATTSITSGNGLVASGATYPASGTNAELGYNGTSVYLRGFDRTGATYKSLSINEGLTIAGGSAGDVSLAANNLVPTTAAKGVNFTANTPAAGMTSQLLNWYEEGTFTPSFSAATGGTIVSTGAATYTRTGRQVVVRGYVFTTNVSLAGKSGQVSISGLPFTASGDSLVSATALYVAGSYNAPLAFVSCGTVAGTLIGLQKPYSTTAVQPFATTDLNTTGNANLVYFNATYFI